MTHHWTPSNLAAWMEQAFLLAALGSLLLALFRVRHPGVKLAYCHVLLAVCLLLPWLQPWRSTGGNWTVPYFAVTSIPLWNVRAVAAVLIAGGAARLGWLLAGLWRIRRCRVASTPMYPIPESVQAAVAVTQADAAFCISPEIPGPVMLGWLAPVVLMPESFLGLAEDAQCGVACHELLHVRRHDWLVTVLEELVGTALWFNPAIWPLLAQTRLAREQLVDAEVVRLTASREPYIDALLAIAKGGSQLDLAPTPLFLRRRHLTQRVHSLLKEGTASTLRIVASYASITAMLFCAGWLGATAFPLVGQAARTPVAIARPAVVETPAVAPVSPALETTPEPAAPSEPATETDAAAHYTPSAPVPADPHELVTGGARALTSSDASAARELLNRARNNARMKNQNAPPYRYEVSFAAAGNVAQTGPGQMTEIRIPGTRRWTAELAGFSLTRWISNGWTRQDKASSTSPVVPMRIQELRDAIEWADGNLPAAKLVRSAAAQWNGRPVTCLLFSNWKAEEAASTPTRLWEETEYCIDEPSGLIQIESIAPGAYTVFGYGGGAEFHGKPVPDNITIYTGGAVAADAHLTYSDPGPSDVSLLTPEENATSPGPFVLLDPRQRTPMPVQGRSALGMIQPGVIHPVVVEAEIDGNGQVIEEELCAASDPSLAHAAMDLVKATRFKHRAWNQYQLYVNVKFMPATQ